MEVVYVSVERINPAPYNPRLDLQPGDIEYTKIKRSLDEFGLVEPLVWNKRTGNLVGGHQRFKVLLVRGDKEVPVVEVDLDDKREKALNLALNKVQGGWDEAKLAQLLSELIKTDSFDLVLTGFEIDESRELIDRVIGGLDEEPLEHQPELDDGYVPVTQQGDLIVLGSDPTRQHRLLCGDSTDPAQVRRLMGGERAALFATDPPYLVGYDGGNRPDKRSGWSRAEGHGWDDEKANPDLYQNFCRVAVDEAVLPDAAWYCWHASKHHAMLARVWEDLDVLAHCQIIWDKGRGLPTHAWYLWRHEPCLFGWQRGRMPKRISKDKLSTVWELDTLPAGIERPDHPTPKPVELFEIPMRQHTRAGDICYEPFAGSGTQVIAAERLGRRCFAMELSPRYCDLIVRRYIRLAGENAVTKDIAQKYAVNAGKEVL